MTTDESNLVAMLRDTVRFLEQRGNPIDAIRVDDAADEIERLREEAAERELILAGCEAMIQDLRAEVVRFERELAAMTIAHGAATGLALRVFRERDRLIAAVRKADGFLAEAVAYGLARQEKGEIRKAFREALAGLDPVPTDEGG